MNNYTLKLSNKNTGIFKCLTLVLAYICFFIPFWGINNITPLVMLALMGIMTFFLPNRNRINKYFIFCIAYFSYVVAMDFFIFTEYHGVTIYRSMIAAFFSGAALYYAVNDKNIFFLNFSTSSVIILTVSILIYIALWDKTDLIFDQRLVLFHNHPTHIGFPVAVALLAGLTTLTYDKAPKKYLTIINSETLLCQKLAKILDFLTSKKVLLAGTLCATILLLRISSTSSILGTFAGIFIIILFKLASRFGFFKSLFTISLIVCSLYTILYLTPINTSNMPLYIAKTIKTLKNPFDQPTFNSRKPLWESAWQSGCESPVIGHGPKSFAYITNKSFYEKNKTYLYDKYGKNIIENDTKDSPHAHNQFLQLFTEQGIIGLLFFIGILFYPLLTAFKNRQLLGVMAPFLIFTLVFSISECILQYRSSVAFPATALFSCIGYFACIPHANRRKYDNN